MSLKREEVQRIAALAKLELTEAQLERYATQLTSILEHIETLNQLPAASAPALEMSHEASPMRPDVVSNPADSELGLAQAPDREGDFFRVPRIIE